MIRLFKKIKNSPEKRKVIFFGQMGFLKNLAVFLFYIIVGLVFRSWFLVAIALYSGLIGVVRNNCTRGLKKNKDSIKDIKYYTQGGIILTISSVFYIAYSISYLYYPSNITYNLVIGILLASIATFTVAKGIVGVVRASGKTMLIREYKMTNLASAMTSVMLAQIAILSFTAGNSANIYTGILGVILGFIIMSIGLYLAIDGFSKRRKYQEIIKRYPEIVKYLNFD